MLKRYEINYLPFPILYIESIVQYYNLYYYTNFFQLSARSRDDLDMEQALGPRGLSTPDVIKSALNKNEVAGGKLSTNAIDNLFGAPDKIVIPERYVPDAVSC